MGYYADLEVERQMFGYEDDITLSYSHQNHNGWSKETLKTKISTFVGLPANADLCSKIGDFAKSVGFDAKNTKSNAPKRAKYQFVWHRRKAFKTYLQNGRK